MASTIDWGRVIQVIAERFHSTIAALPADVTRTGFMEPEPDGYTALIRIGGLTATSRKRNSTNDADVADIELQIVCKIDPVRGATKPAGIGTLMGYAASLFDRWGASADGHVLNFYGVTQEIEIDGQMAAAIVTHRGEVTRSSGATFTDFIT